MARGIGPNYAPHHLIGETRQAFKRLVEKSPQLTQPQIAAELGVSRARVRELARKEGKVLEAGKSGRPPKGAVVSSGA